MESTYSRRLSCQKLQGQHLQRALSDHLVRLRSRQAKAHQTALATLLYCRDCELDLCRSDRPTYRLPLLLGLLYSARIGVPTETEQRRLPAFSHQRSRIRLISLPLHETA